MMYVIIGFTLPEFNNAFNKLRTKKARPLDAFKFIFSALSPLETLWKLI